MNADGSCQHAVNESSVNRLLCRMSVGSANTGGYCIARQNAVALAKAAQQPVAKLVSVPFQGNFNFNTGPHEKPPNVLNFQSQAFYNLE